MRQVEVHASVPKIVAMLIKPFSSFFFYIPEDKQKEIEDLIEEDQFDLAEQLIQEVEKETGATSFTLKLSTRISRIRIIGR